MAQNIELETPSGKLRGSRQNSCLGQDYYSFKGIPYAQPPIGSLRFSDPEPIKPWTGVRDALKHGPTALQFDMASNKIEGSEDCLYLNVYTRSLDIDARMPVMFWIHGGAFVVGSGNDDNFGPDYLLAKDVVLVTCNYRLGVFGFLNLDDEVAPGNQGLKDQAMALRWVNTHIRHFGGDPDNVTIFGASAGGSSAHYIALSPLTKGLFHKVICQSGSILNPWAEKYQAAKSLTEFLKILGCNESEPKAILDFLREQDSLQLTEAQTKLMSAKNWMQLNFPFGVCVDKKSPQPFVPVEPFTLVKEGIQVPCIIGNNNFEGLIGFLFLGDIDKKDLDKNTEEYFAEKLQKILLNDYNLTIPDLRKYYMQDKEINEETTADFLKLWGDLVFCESLHKFAEIQSHASSAPTYYYVLNFDKNITPTKFSIKKPIEGVSHGDELIYLFRANSCDALGLKQLQPDTGAERVVKQMVELWTNFAKHGKPTVTTSELIPIHWQPVDNSDVIHYLDIDEELNMSEMKYFQKIFASETVKS